MQDFYQSMLLCLGSRELEGVLKSLPRHKSLPLIHTFVRVVLSPEGGLNPLRLVERSVTTDGWENGVAARSASWRG